MNGTWHTAFISISLWMGLTRLLSSHQTCFDTILSCSLYHAAIWASIYKRSKILLTIKLLFNGLVCSLLHLYLTLPKSCEGLKSTTVHSPISRYPYRHACMIQAGYIFSAAPQQHRSDVRGVPQLDVLDETHKPRALSWGKPQNTTPKTQNIYVKYFNLNKVACFFPPLPPASKPTSRGENWDEYLSGRQNMEHIRRLRIPGRCRHSSAHRP